MKQIRASTAGSLNFSRVDNLAGLLHIGIVCIIAVVLNGGAQAAAYPTRAITVIVPFAAGGPTDTVTRITTRHLALTLGQQFIIENVVGSGGTTAAMRAMRGPTDGYTLMMGQIGTHGSAPAIYPNLPYDPAKNFAPIGLVVEIPVVVIARNDLPVRTLPELISYLRDHPDTTMGHAGTGSLSHAACTLLESIGKFRSAAKSFQGTGPALQALLEGRVDFMCDQIVNSIDRIRAGDLRALAIAADQRNSFVPDVPTAAEAGFAGFTLSAWDALFAPTNTPPEVIERLSAALDKALDDPEIRAELTALAGEIPPSDRRGPAALARRVGDETARWKQLLKPNNPGVGR